MMVSTETQSYRDGIDITAQDVYQLQQTQNLKTSSPKGEDVIHVLEQIKADGYSHVIILTIASA